MSRCIRRWRPRSTPARRPAPALIAKDDGTHYSKEALGNSFREAVAAAGIPVTKKGSDEKGASAPRPPQGIGDHCRRVRCNRTELNAMFGWSGHQMAQHYTKKADRKRLASRAMAK